MGKTQKRKQPATAVVRCAIYTRKSTDEGLNQEFNSLDAQRESAEAYVTSQRHEGWQCLPNRYDDGGFTGGNMDRPALARLLRDIEEGKVDCVVVYKVDRLSRSLLDFAKMMEVFEAHNVSFVSVTQQFNTASSMGRLVLNVLLSFAQFEREIISERTRDKIAAARRRGKWAGGMPLLGYDIDRETSKLVVNEDEALRVRSMFALYLEHKSLLSVVKELDRRGWRTKLWTTKQGTERGGKVFTKTSLHKLLTNVTYLGKVKHKDEVYEGEHDAIVNAEVWQKVQAVLQHNGRTGGALVRNQFGALLKGLLRCVACDSAMMPTHTTKPEKRYRYYVCCQAQKRGWHTCPSKSIAAGQIEQFVVEQIRGIGKDPSLVRETLAQARSVANAQRKELKAELTSLEKEIRKWNGEVRVVLDDLIPDADEASNLARLAELQERIRCAETRAADIQFKLQDLDRSDIDESEVKHALGQFDLLWDSLALRDQIRILRLLIDHIDYDGQTNKIVITFHRTGIRTLTNELCNE
ncbi:MAG: recombinase family protein [Gemmataceae bacterium]